MLAVNCKIVDDLPLAREGPTRWDLRELVLEGESSPLSAKVVEDWLELIYVRMGAPRRQRKQPPSSLQEAKPLLLFMGATDTIRAVIDEYVRSLTDNGNDLCMEAAVGEQLRAKFKLRGCVYYYHQNGLTFRNISNASTCLVFSSEQFEPHKTQFLSSVSSELEAWLYLAGRMQLVPLAQLLQGFIQSQLVANNVSIVLHGITSVYSKRVLECMPRELLLAGFLRDSLMNRPAGVQLAAGKATIVCTSRLAAGLFNHKPGASEEMLVRILDNHSVIEQPDTGCSLDLNMVLGPSTYWCTRLVEEILGKVTDDE